MLKAILTVDVEEWFNLPTVAEAGPENWPRFESRVARDCDRMLAYQSEWKARSTWFVVGALAEKLAPQLRAARDAGHVIGCHSYDHRLCTELSAAEFARDLDIATAAIAGAAGATPTLFRAPMWSLHPHMLDHYRALKAAGYEISSSWLPGRGDPASVAETGVRELPIDGYHLSKKIPIPWSGTWVMRRMGAKRLLKRVSEANARGITPIFWIHTWELDPDPPVIPGGPVLRFVHNYRLAELPGIFAELSKDIAWQPLS
jgi:peptidoglycan/xylan/chitin deacetylase (PgdA/CDA1 family)